MKEIQLTKNMVAIVDDEDFEMLNQWKWRASESHRTYYAKRHLENTWAGSKEIMMHRVIMGDPVGLEVDHKDGVGLHNWRSNLRIVTTQQNNWNTGLKINNKTGYKGVSWHKMAKAYTSSIGYNYKRYHLGIFPTPEEAAHAYDKKAKELFGEFAYLNFPEECA